MPGGDPLPQGSSIYPGRRRKGGGATTAATPTTTAAAVVVAVGGGFNMIGSGRGMIRACPRMRCTT